MGLICHFDNFLDIVSRRNFSFDRYGLEVGCDSVDVEEASSVPRSGYCCFEGVDGQVCYARVSGEYDILAESDACNEIVGGRRTLARAQTLSGSSWTNVKVLTFASEC